MHTTEPDTHWVLRTSRREIHWVKGSGAVDSGGLLSSGASLSFTTVRCRSGLSLECPGSFQLLRNQYPIEVEGWQSTVISTPAPNRLITFKLKVHISCFKTAFLERLYRVQRFRSFSAYGMLLEHELEVPSFGARGRRENGECIIIYIRCTSRLTAFLQWVVLMSQVQCRSLLLIV